jgi:CheY-like chemotaxis protein
VPKTLLVVDDSATMRKVFELTFAGEDVTVVTHDGGESLMARAREVRPAVAIVDVNLVGGDGYALARQLKSDPSLRGMQVLMLFSEQSPLDETRMRGAEADGSISKPFDTQAAIDKVRPLLAAGPGAAAAAPGPPAPAAAPSAVRGGTMVAGAAAPPPGPARTPTAAGVGAFGAPPGPSSVPKSTQMFGAGSAPPMGVPTAPKPAAPAPAPAHAPASDSHDADIELEVDADDEILRPTPQPMQAVKPAAAPGPAPAPARAPTPAPSASAAVASASAEVAQRAQGLGLTPAQVDAVTALTREVVERVVWEVVPQLAETMIREEIKRLTAE